jgi:nicotinamidase-related amidase
MAIWDDFLTTNDKATFAQSGYGAYLGPGERPVLLVVDVSYAFTGDKDEPLADSITKWHNSCGPSGWKAMPYLQQLLAAARSRNLPIFYSTGYPARPDGFGRGLWRNSRNTESAPPLGYDPQEIVREIAPEPRDVVFAKRAPSVFHGTPLASDLRALNVDTLIIVGTTTSGCVRATAVDAFSHNFRVVLAEEGCFDRGEASHAIALFDLNAKYADVLPTATVIDYIDGLGSDLYEGQIAPALPALVAASA